MKKKYKIIFKLLFLIAITIALSSNFNKKYGFNNFSDLNQRENASCTINEFPYSDFVAFQFMQGSKGRIECDILNGTFVEIKEITHDLHLLETLQQQNVLNKTKKYLQLNETFYSFNLNFYGLMKKVKLRDLICEAQSFDKKLNVTEQFEIVTKEKRQFEKKYNHTLYFKNHGFYYISCYNASKPTVKIYDDSFMVLPNNMSKLLEERKYFKSLEIKGNSITHESDIDNIKFLEANNKLKLKKKMNVLMLGFDSLSYQHLKRAMPKTFKYLNETLFKNTMFTLRNRIGENTHPNIIPLLSGIFISDVISINKKSEFSTYKNIDGNFHDKYPFIWHRYEKDGYLTALQVYI